MCGGEKVLEHTSRDEMIKKIRSNGGRYSHRKAESPNWAAQWSVARSQVKQMTWCSWLLYPSNTKPKARKYINRWIRIINTPGNFTSKTGEMTVVTDILHTTQSVLICLMLTEWQLNCKSQTLAVIALSCGVGLLGKWKVSSKQGHFMWAHHSFAYMVCNTVFGLKHI